MGAELDALTKTLDRILPADTTPDEHKPDRTYLLQRIGFLEQMLGQYQETIAEARQLLGAKDSKAADIEPTLDLLERRLAELAQVNATRAVPMLTLRRFLGLRLRFHLGRWLRSGQQASTNIE